VRLATIVPDGTSAAAVVDGGRVLFLPRTEPGFGSVREIAAGGQRALDRVSEWAVRQREASWRPMADVPLGPVVPDPGAIYAIGLNYGDAGEPVGARPPRPLVYGKAPTSVVGHGAAVSWDRTLTANVDAEVELGVVVGEQAFDVSPDEAMRHVFGYTCINDISSRDLWLDGDQWLLGKSMPGFCPVGPWVVTRDELDPLDLRLGCTINGSPIQDGRTSGMRFSIPEIVAFLSRYAVLRPGDLIATGTPARLATPPGPDRRLQPGDIVTVSIERIGELTTTIG
jgi:2-keto-4-pentenoate hydratase/2-oxohepta-3-ene-1,7-dioic acid hydratase in catechol pathway